MRRLTRPMMPAVIAFIGLDLFDAYLIATIDELSLAALSFTIPVTASLFAIAIGLSVATTAILSQSLGQGDHDCTQKLTSHCLLIALGCAILFSLIGLATIEPLFELLGANYALIPDSFHLGPKPDIMPIISDYMQLRYLGFGLMLIPIIANSVMRSTGDTRFAGRLMFCWAGFTAFLDYLLISYSSSANLFHLAVGHLIADFIFSLLSIYLLARRENLIALNRYVFEQLKQTLFCLMKIGLPATAMSLLVPLTLGIVTSWVAFYGREQVAAFGVIARIETLMLFIPMALSTALPIFVGQNFAAGAWHRSLCAITASLRTTLVSQLMLYLIVILMVQPIAKLFADSIELQQQIAFLLYLLPLGYAGKGVGILVGSSLNAMHKANSALSLTLIKMLGLYLPAAYFGAYFYGLNGLYIGLLIANLATGLVAYLWLINQFKHFTV